MPESLMNKGIERIPFAPVNPSVVSSSLTGAAKKGDTNTFMFVSPFSRFQDVV